MTPASCGEISVVQTTVQASRACDKQPSPERVREGTRNLGWRWGSRSLAFWGAKRQTPALLGYAVACDDRGPQAGGYGLDQVSSLCPESLSVRKLLL